MDHSVYAVGDLEAWDERIREKLDTAGLTCYPQQFEICDHNQMLAYMAYSGVPSHYPHWSYGKSYERQKTLYDYGVSGLPYEMVINSNPALAYLMRDNSLLLQILTIAHVYGHNDFFKNNFTFRSTRPEYTIDKFKAHGDRVRAYIEDPSIGLDKVERLLDAAHAISLQCRRDLAIRKRTSEQERADLVEAALPRPDPFRSIHRRRTVSTPDVSKIPPVPDDDLITFVRDHNNKLAGWEKDVLTIVNEEAQYFVPQIETKIMNEGWATYWHKNILNSLELPQELQLEFIVRHNQVVRPIRSGLNAYHVGLLIWEDIRRRYDEPTREEEEDLDGSGCTGTEKIFEVRESDRDSSFLRRHLTEKLVRELNLFEYETRQDQKIVKNTADKEGWRSVKETLLRNVGMGSLPVIKVEDADFGHNHTLYLLHYHDGRDLQLEYAEKTLGHVNRLWQSEVVLETNLEGKRYLLICNDREFSTKAL